MTKEILIGLLIPLAGTSLGAACVYFMKNELKPSVQKVLQGFASGVMIAASVWSLILPAMEQSAPMGKLAFVPSAIGIALGMAFLLFLDSTVPHMHLDHSTEGAASKLSRTTMMILAVTIHNIPEGMAVGVVYAGYLSGNTSITAAGALALSLGIAIQNFPEGAIVSMPLHAEGESKNRSFLLGVLSGVVEPAAGGLTILALNWEGTYRGFVFLREGSTGKGHRIRLDHKKRDGYPPETGGFRIDCGRSCATFSIDRACQSCEDVL